MIAIVKEQLSVVPVYIFFKKRYCCNMKARLRLKIIFNVLFVDLLQMN